MSYYTGDPCPAQPISECIKRILLGIVAKLPDKSEQKLRILDMRDDGLLDAAEVRALFYAYRLGDV